MNDTCEESNATIHCANLRAQALRKNMLDHLLDYEPPVFSASEAQPLERADPMELTAAQISTAQWLEQMGAPSAKEIDTQLNSALAQQALKALASTEPVQNQKEALLALKTPPAVRHLAGMLTAYDWAFVEQAKELRGYAVSQILEETKHPDARIRLKALDMLGRVTEVALFTDRMEIKKTQMSDTEIDAKIKEKLNKFMGVVDADPTEAQIIEAPPVQQAQTDETA